MDGIIQTITWIHSQNTSSLISYHQTCQKSLGIDWVKTHHEHLLEKDFLDSNLSKISWRRLSQNRSWTPIKKKRLESEI